MQDHEVRPVRIEATPVEKIEAPISAADWLDIAGAALSLAGAILGAS